MYSIVRSFQKIWICLNNTSNEMKAKWHRFGSVTITSFKSFMKTSEKKKKTTKQRKIELKEKNNIKRRRKRKRNIDSKIRAASFWNLNGSTQCIFLFLDTPTLFPFVWVLFSFRLFFCMNVCICMCVGVCFFTFFFILIVNRELCEHEHFKTS